jgi:hypothetical protein
VTTARGRRLRTVALALSALPLLWLDLGGGPLSTLRDDAYYYFCQVRSLLAGRGPAVSADVPTSGVQPLWTAVLLPLAAAFGVDALPAKAAAFGLVLHAWTALGIAGLGRWRPIAWAIAVLHLANPYLLREAQNGQETALACFLLLWLWRLRRAPRWRFAALATLAILARIDLWLVVALLACARDGARGLLVPLATLLPYCGVNVLLGGSCTAHSGLPMPWHVWETFLAGNPDPAAWLRRLWHYGRPALLGGPFDDVAPVGLGVLACLVLRAMVGVRMAAVVVLFAALDLLRRASVLTLLVAGAACLVHGVRRAPPAAVPRHRWRWTATAALLAAMVGIVVLHDLLRQYPRAYYFAPLAVAGAIGLLRWPDWRLVALAALVQFGWVRAQEDSLTGQGQMVLAGEHLGAVLPAGTAVGCFNSGIVTWSYAGPVHNLDGVVDAGAFGALRARRLSAWLDERGVDFVVDSPHEFAPGPALHRRGRYFGADFDAVRDLEAVCAFDVEGGRERHGGARAAPFVLYRRRGRGTPPTPASARVLRDTGDAAVVLLPRTGAAGFEVHVGDHVRTLDVTELGAAVVTAIARDPQHPTRITAAGNGGVLLQLDPAR